MISHFGRTTTVTWLSTTWSVWSASSGFDRGGGGVTQLLDMLQALFQRQTPGFFSARNQFRTFSEALDFPEGQE